MSTVKQRIEAAERELAAAKEQLKQEQTPEIIEGHFYVALKQNNTETVRTGDERLPTLSRCQGVERRSGRYTGSYSLL